MDCTGPWHQLLRQTEKMVHAAEAEAWDRLAMLQLDRQRLLTDLPAPAESDASLLIEILKLNQLLEQLGGDQKQFLADTIRQGQKTENGIGAYQEVTATRH